MDEVWPKHKLLVEQTLAKLDRTFGPQEEESLVVSQFEFAENTPKALATLSPVVGAKRQPWVANVKIRINAESVRHVQR